MAGLGILALLVLSIASFKSYSDLRLGRGREAQLKSEIAQGDERIEALEERIKRLKGDPAMLEQLAREELLMARPGEVVIVLPEAAVEAIDQAPDEPAAGSADEAGDN
jgi:cell division protein FtsB